MCSDAFSGMGLQNMYDTQNQVVRSGNVTYVNFQFSGVSVRKDCLAHSPVEKEDDLTCRVILGLVYQW